MVRGKKKKSLCTSAGPCSMQEDAHSIILLLREKQELKRANPGSCTLLRLATGDSLSGTRCCWKGHDENTPALSIKWADTNLNPLVIVSEEADFIENKFGSNFCLITIWRWVCLTVLANFNKSISLLLLIEHRSNMLVNFWEFHLFWCQILVFNCVVSHQLNEMHYAQFPYNSENF